MKRPLSLALLISTMSALAFSAAYAAGVPTSSLSKSSGSDLSEANPVEHGLLDLRGSICELETGSHELAAVQGSQHRFVIPLGVYLSKKEAVTLARGACAFALPIKARPGMKVVVANSSQLISLRAYPSSKVKMDLELFKAGSVGEKQVRTIESAEKAVRSAEFLRHPEVLVESECGKEMILRGQLTATLLGSGAGRVFTRNLELDMIEVPCE